MYHKPLGVLSSIGDPWGRDNLEGLGQKYPFIQHMHPVGRLDLDTSGLLLFSRNGWLTNFLLNPMTKMEREYEAIVEGEVHFDLLRHKLQSGVETSDGKFPAKLLDSQVLSIPNQSPNSCIRLTVTEGKYRMVRRILHNSGHSVLSLRRIRYGGILLGDLEEGNCRPLIKSELLWFLSKANKQS